MIDSGKNFLDRADEQLTVLQLNATTSEAAVPTVVTPPKSFICSMYSPLQTQEDGWNGAVIDNSLPEVFGTIPIVRGENVPMWKTWSTFFGPGAMVAVGGPDIIFSQNLVIEFISSGQQSTPMQ